MAGIEDFWNLGITEQFGTTFGGGRNKNPGALPAWAQEKYGPHDYRVFWDAVFNMMKSAPEDQLTNIQYIGQGDFLIWSSFIILREYDKNNEPLMNEGYSIYGISNWEYVNHPSCLDFKFDNEFTWEDMLYGPSNTAANPYSPSTEIPFPDYIAITISGNGYVGGGYGQDSTIGWVKGDGIFGYTSYRVGAGVDVSAGISLTFGFYSGSSKPTVESTTAFNMYENFGAGILNFGLQHDVNVGRAIGRNWNYASVGLSLGSKSVYGGSIGTSYTTNPFFHLKF